MTIVEVESSSRFQTVNCEIFLAEMSTDGSFGRRNYFGVNWGRQVLVPLFPYALQVSFVVVLRIPGSVVIDDLNFDLSSSWGDRAKYPIGPLSRRDTDRTY